MVENVSGGGEDARIEREYMGCVQCGDVPVKSRGLCMRCYQAARRGGYLSDYPKDEVYDLSWCEATIAEMFVVHGDKVASILGDYLADWEFKREREREQ